MTSMLIMWGSLGVIVLGILIPALIGLIRGLKKSLGTTIVIILSAIIAFIVTAIVFKPSVSGSGAITNMIAELFQRFGGAEAIRMPGVLDALSVYAYMILAPFIFMLLFIVIRFILGIAMMIAIRFIPIMNNLPPVAKRLGGLGVGIANGFIITVILLMPIFGTVDVVNTAMKDLSSDHDGKMNSEIAEYNEYIDSIVDSGVGKMVINCGGRLMYNSLSSVKYYGEKVTLKNEVKVLAKMVNTVTSTDESTNSMIAAVDAVAEGVDSSPIVKSLAANIMSGMSNAWLNGEKFMGIEKTSMGKWFDPVVDVTLEIFATEDKAHVQEDLKCISDFMHAADDIGIINAGDEAFQVFSEKGNFARMLATIENNDRMLPLIDELNILSIKVFADDLGFADNNKEIYDDLLESIGDKINQHTEGLISRDTARADILNEFMDHGIDLSDEAAQDLCEGLLDEYDSVYSNMPDRVREFFMLYSAAANATLVENADGTLSANGVILQNYNTYNYRNSQAYMLANAGASIGDAETLTSADEMKTVLITTEQILDSIVKYSDISDKHTESEMIDGVVVSMIESYNNIGGESLHASYVMSQMGVVLDKMHATHVYGGATEIFLKAVMQSHKVSSSIGLNIMEMTDFANTIHNGMSESTGYDDISVTLSHSFEVLESINKGQSKHETVKELMKDITPETAKVMQDVATPSLMQNYGVKPENAEKSSNAISALFGNMSSYTTEHPQGDMSDEEYKDSISHEANAVDKIITLSIKANEDIDDKEALFNTDDGSGALDISAYDLVDLFATSKVADDTVNELVYGKDGTEYNFDPLGAEKGFLKSDKEELSEALDEYGKNNSHVDGIEDTLGNIGALFGINYNA